LGAQLSGTAKFAGWLLGLALVGGCVHPRRPLVVTDSDPSIKIPATEIAVQRHDLSAVPQMIKDLESDDPAVRLYASYALEELTKQSFGYRYYDDEDQREAAIGRWRRWYAEHGKPTTAGAMEKP
jgi:HEAT repeat protein